MTDLAQVIQELDLLPMFASESAGHLTRVEHLLTNLDAAADPAQELRPVLRTLHTIKSSASVLRLVPIAAPIHRIETLPLTVQDGVRIWNRAIADQVAAMIESLRQTIAQITGESVSGTESSVVPLDSVASNAAPSRRTPASDIVPQAPRVSHCVRFDEPKRSEATQSSAMRNLNRLVDQLPQVHQQIRH